MFNMVSCSSGLELSIAIKMHSAARRRCSSMPTPILLCNSPATTTRDGTKGFPADIIRQVGLIRACSCRSAGCSPLFRPWSARTIISCPPNRNRVAKLLYCIFDMMFCDGEDLRGLRLLERKDRLRVSCPGIRCCRSASTVLSTAFDTSRRQRSGASKASWPSGLTASISPAFDTRQGPARRRLGAGAQRKPAPGSCTTGATLR
jgi:hypothetical protein